MVPSLQPDLLRSSGDTDVRNRITFSGGWDLPFDNAWKSGPKKITQGWSLFPIVTWRTGFPLDVLANLPDLRCCRFRRSFRRRRSVDRSCEFRGTCNTFNPRMQQTFSGFINGNGLPGNYYFNPTASAMRNVATRMIRLPCTPGPTIFLSDAQVVANPSLATYGTVPRNFLRGPGLNQCRFGGVKDHCVVAGKVKLELRFEFFNLLTIAEFSNPDTNITSPTFGQILNTADPRIIQIAARLTF